MSFVKDGIRAEQWRAGREGIGSNAPRRGGSPGTLAWLLALALGGCGLEATEPGGGTESTEETSAEDIGSIEQGLAESTCGHSICETGPAVSATCDSCVASICAVDSFCCTVAWDSLCVKEVTTVCGRGPVPVSSSTLVSSLQIRIRTGGDDLRAGSQAYGSFQLTTGTTLPASLNGGLGFPSGSEKVATVTFSPARALGTFERFLLTWDGAPRNWFDTYDNWDADEIQFTIEPPGRCPRFLGAPFFPGRMTGSHTLASTAVSFP